MVDAKDTDFIGKSHTFLAKEMVIGSLEYLFSLTGVGVFLSTDVQGEKAKKTEKVKAKSSSAQCLFGHWIYKNQTQKMSG